MEDGTKGVGVGGGGVEKGAGWVVAEERGEVD